MDSTGHDESNFKEALCKELGSIHNISKIFVESIAVWHTTGLAGSLCPFDVVEWCKKRKDDCLLLACTITIRRSRLCCAPH